MTPESSPESSPCGFFLRGSRKATRKVLEEEDHAGKLLAIFGIVIRHIGDSEPVEVFDDEASKRNLIEDELRDAGPAERAEFRRMLKDLNPLHVRHIFGTRRAGCQIRQEMCQPRRS